MRILLIEDDEHLVWSIKARMEKNGYVVDFECDGLLGRDVAMAISYDIIILDIMLPSIDGFAVCKYLREHDVETPILMLTARYQERDKVHGLDCGADDYLSKPFSYPELYARIRALLRRKNNKHSPELHVGQLCIDTVKKMVRLKSREIILTSKEYQILEYLAYNRNGIVTKDMLQIHIWGDECSIYSNVIEVFVSRLRNKLHSEDGDPIIKTVKGLGYMIKDAKH
jgi:DNA-binding response OmpR family regulator